MQFSLPLLQLLLLMLFALLFCYLLLFVLLFWIPKRLPTRLIYTPWQRSTKCRNCEADPIISLGSGALLLGAGVTDTIRSKISKYVP
jgi:hypothetical protein